MTTPEKPVLVRQCDHFPHTSALAYPCWLMAKFVKLIVDVECRPEGVIAQRCATSADETRNKGPVKLDDACHVPGVRPCSAAVSPPRCSCPPNRPGSQCSRGCLSRARIEIRISRIVAADPPCSLAGQTPGALGNRSRYFRRDAGLPTRETRDPSPWPFERQSSRRACCHRSRHLRSRD